MLLKSHEIDGAVERRESPFWLICGADAGRATELARRLVARLRGRGLDGVVMDAAEAIASPTALHRHLTGASLFAAGTVVRLRGAGDTLTKLMKPMLAEGIAPGCMVVVEGGDLSKSSSLRKLFDGAKNAISLVCYAPTRDEMVRAAKAGLSKTGVQAAPGAAETLVDLLPPDGGALAREIEKLAILAGGARLTPEDVREAVGDQAEAALDDMCAGMGAGDPVRAMVAVRRLLDGGEAPIALLRVAQRHLRRIHRCAAAMAEGADPDAAMAALRPPVFFKQKAAFRAQILRWTVPQAEMAMARLIEGEHLAKSGYPDAAVAAHAVLEATLRAAPQRALTKGR
jgi:DNA polymerase-3 subunit delta